MIRITGPLTVWKGDRIEIAKEVIIQADRESEIICKGCVLTNSLVNAHTHLPMVLMRGMVTEKNFWDWLQEVQEIEEAMGRREVRAGYYLGIWENMVAGNTRIYSMYRGYDLVETTLGVDLHIGPISFRESDTDVPTLMERFEKRAPDGVVPTLFAHSLYTLPPERLKEMAEMREYDLQIHVSETKEEVLRVKERYGQYPVRVMHAMGLLRENTMLVHAGWITKGELDLVAERGARLVHVPASNTRLAIHGFFPWREAEERGIPVLFGTDSPVSNDGQSVLADIRLALLCAKDRYWDASLFGWRNVMGAFDRDGLALWRPITPLRHYGVDAVNTLLYAPHTFTLHLLLKKGKILYPRPVPRVVTRSLRIFERFRDKISG